MVARKGRDVELKEGDTVIVDQFLSIHHCEWRGEILSIWPDEELDQVWVIVRCFDFGGIHEINASRITLEAT